MPSPNIWRALGDALQQGSHTYNVVSEQERAQRERDRAFNLQKQEAQQHFEEARRREETEQLQRRILQHTLEQQPSDDALKDLKTRIDMTGLESTLNDPATLPLAERAGVHFDTRQPAKPEWFSPAQHASGADITPDMVSRHENRGIFEKTGIVKPPEVMEKEAERAQAIQRAEAIQRMLSGLGGSENAPEGIDDSPAGRIRMKLGLGVNGNDVWGPVRETPAQSAAKAGADAGARLPFQKQLLDYATQQRGADAGDPYFNEALRILSGFMPATTPEQAARLVEDANNLAAKAQAAHPRGKVAPTVPGGGAAPPPGPNQPRPSGAPPAMDSLIQQAVKAFGGFDQAMEKSKDPVAQAGLKAAGIDPAAYLRRMQAMKILDSMSKR